MFRLARLTRAHVATVLALAAPAIPLVLTIASTGGGDFPGLR